MYHTLIERLQYYHNDDKLYKSFSSLIFPFDNCASNSTHVLIINDEVGNIAVFEILPSSNNEPMIDEFKAWVDVLENHDYNNYIETSENFNRHRVTTCLYCEDRAFIYSINDHIYLCLSCLSELKISESGKLNTVFPIILNGNKAHFDNPMVYYNIDGMSLNLWYISDNIYYRSRLIFSERLSSVTYTGGTVYYNKSYDEWTCNICGIEHQHDTESCNQCDNIVSFRNNIAVKFLFQKLLQISQLDIIVDIKTRIVGLLIFLTLI